MNRPNSNPNANKTYEELTSSGDAAAIEELRRLVDEIGARKRALGESPHPRALSSFATGKNVPRIPENTSRPFKVVPARNLKGHYSKIYALSWDPSLISGSTRGAVISASADGTLIIWDAIQQALTTVIVLQSQWVMTCCYSPNGDYVACGGLDNICSIYRLSDVNQHVAKDLSKPTPVFKQFDLYGYLSRCRFLDDSHIVVSCGDFTCSLWDITSTSRAVMTFGPDNEGHTADAMCVAVDKTRGRDGCMISVGCDAAAKVWDLRTARCVRTFVDHEQDINCVVYFPDHSAFATGSDEGLCLLYDLRANGIVQSYSPEQFSGSVTSLDFSKSGRFLITGYEVGPDDPGVLVFDTLYGDVVQKLHCRRGQRVVEQVERVSAVGMSADGFALATGTWDSSVRIWTTG